MWGDFNFGSCHVVEGGGNKARPKEGEIYFGKKRVTRYIILRDNPATHCLILRDLISTKMQI